MRKKVFTLMMLYFASNTCPPRCLSEEPTSAPIQLAHINLDVCGIGQFTFEGEAVPGGKFTYSVPLAEMSDVLRNLVVEDPENCVAYAKVVAELSGVETALRLPNTDTFGDLLLSMRGEQVDINLLDESSVSGRIISVERQPTVKDDLERPILLTLATASGIQCLELNQIKTVLPTRPEMKSRLAAALDQQIAANDEDYREIEIGFAGQQTRHVSIRLTRPMPTWRTAYSFANSRLEQRIVFDNCTRQPWSNVSIRFTARSPVVFQTPLHQVLRSHRNIVSIPGRNLAVPATADEALDAYTPRQQMIMEDLVFAENKNNGGLGGGGMGGGGGGGFGGGGMGSAGASSNSLVISATADVLEPFQDALRSKLTSPNAKWSKRSNESGAPFAALFTGLAIEPNKTHVLTTPKLDVETTRLSVFRREYHPEKPLSSLQITNRMSFRLPAGPLTVFDELGNAGEVMLMTLAPSVRQLVSFALDDELKIQYELIPESLISHALDFDDTHFAIMETKEVSRDHQYSIENRGVNGKQLLIEHPKPDGGWVLSQSKDLQEEATDVARYRVDTKASESQKLLVNEKKTQIEQHEFSKVNLAILQAWLDDMLINDAAKKHVRKLMDIHQRLANARIKTDDMAAAITLNKTEVSRITNLWKSADPFGSDNSNKSKYEAKIAECEKRISKFETEIQEVAKEGLGLLELLGITESHSSPYGVSKLDGRRWLDLSNQSSDAEVKP